MVSDVNLHPYNSGVTYERAEQIHQASPPKLRAVASEGRMSPPRRPVPLGPEDSLTGTGIARPMSSIQEQMLAAAAAREGVADVTAEVLLSRTALNRKPKAPKGTPRKGVKSGRTLVPRVAMTVGLSG